MKSAYAILGIPGNATMEEIGEAFQKASGYFSREKLVENPTLIDRLNEIKEAHQILSVPDLRRAHDRKLNQSVVMPTIQPRVVVEKEGFNPGKLLKLMAVVVVAMFAIGAYMSHSRELAREAEAAEELAQKQLDAQAAAQAAAEKDQADAAKARADALAENRERQLRAESLVAARVSSLVEMQRQAIMARQAEAERNAAKWAENQHLAEVQRKLADDRRRLGIH